MFFVLASIGFEFRSSFSIAEKPLTSILLGLNPVFSVEHLELFEKFDVLQADRDQSTFSTERGLKSYVSPSFLILFFAFLLSFCSFSSFISSKWRVILLI